MPFEPATFWAARFGYSWALSALFFLPRGFQSQEEKKIPAKKEPKVSWSLFSFFFKISGARFGKFQEKPFFNEQKSFDLGSLI